MDINEIRLINLNKLIEEAQGKKPLAKRANIKANYLSQVHSPAHFDKSDKLGDVKLRNLGDKVARKLEAAMGKPPGWMDQLHESRGVGIKAVHSQRVPILSWDEVAGARSLDIEVRLAMDATIYVTKTSNTRLFALRVQGDAMVAPEGQVSFPDGSLIIVDPDLRAMTGDFVIVQLPNASEATFKQLVHDGGDAYLKPLNPRYPLKNLPAEGEILGVVIGIQIDIAPRMFAARP